MAFASLAPRPKSHPFQERQISLKESVKIGRAVAKAKSSSENGIFDCKVLSRNHALLWFENGKFMLQDTKSSNGTYVNNVRLSRGSEESEPCELKSGDILQFGVEVVENSKNVTHGCIVGLIRLFYEDGTEATGVQEEIPSGVLPLLSINKNIQPQELWQLSQFLQDALHREQMLENKLVTLQRMIANSHTASEETFQGFIQEDKLLSRLETLENQLEIVSQDVTTEDVQSELMTFQEDRLQYESSAKETLQNILSEKIEALQKCNDLERLLSNSEDEGTYLKSVYEKSQEELQELMDKHRERLDEMQELKDTIAAANARNETQYQNGVNAQQLLKEELEEAERRGSSLAVEVESLQAECDFTKKQLEALQERLQQQQKEVEEDSLEKDDMEKDHPFASDHATLEKEVKNKSAYIQSLKEQLAELQTELMKEKENSSQLQEKLNTEETDIICMTSTSDISEQPVETSVLNETANDGDVSKSFDVGFKRIKELQDLMMNVKDSLCHMAATVQQDSSLNLQCIFWEDFESIPDQSTLSHNEQLTAMHKSLGECKELVKIFNDDLKYLVIALQRLREEKESEESNESDPINDDLSSAQSELESVRQQIVSLGERLMEEQDSNKITKELAANLELKLLHEEWTRKDTVINIARLIKQLYEAHKHMNIEQLDKSMSYASLESARKLASEMQRQASDNARVAGKEKVEIFNLEEENETLKMKVTRLEGECKKLKQENVFISKSNEARRPSHKELSDSFDGTEVPDKNKVTPEDNDNANVSQVEGDSCNELDDTKDSTVECCGLLDNKGGDYNQMTNLIIALFVLLISFGALILLDIIQITPGTLPLFDSKTYTELWEHLF